MNNGTDIWEKFVHHNANGCSCFAAISAMPGGCGTGDSGNQVFQIWPIISSIRSAARATSASCSFSRTRTKCRSRLLLPVSGQLVDRYKQPVYVHQPGCFPQYRPGYLVDSQSVSASLTITNDYRGPGPPAVSAVSAQGSRPSSRSSFDEPVETVSAKTLANYSLDQGIHLTGATLMPDGRTVGLATDSGLPPIRFTH